MVRASSVPTDVQGKELSVQLSRLDSAKDKLEQSSLPSSSKQDIVISVTTTDPVINPGDGLCSLVEAIDNANSDGDTSSGDCPARAGQDIIELGSAETYTLTAVHDSIDGSNGLPSITSTITLNDHGSTIIREQRP